MELLTAGLVFVKHALSSTYFYSICLIRFFFVVYTKFLIYLIEKKLQFIEIFFTISSTPIDGVFLDVVNVVIILFLYTLAGQSKFYIKYYVLSTYFIHALETKYHKFTALFVVMKMLSLIAGI